MGSAKMVKAMQEEARASGEAGPPKKAAKKTPASSSADQETRREKRAKKKAASIRGRGARRPPKQQGSRRPRRTCPRKLPTGRQSLPSPGILPRGGGPRGSPLLILLQTPWDIQVLAGAEDIEAVGHFAANIASAIAWGGEVVKRLTRARRTVRASRQKFDEAMGQHAEVVAWLEELEALRAREEREAKAQVEALETELNAEKEARRAEKEAREALEAELQTAGARAEQAKEDFLKSPEFDALLAKRAWDYFRDGF
ncbi:hypothetical protein F511_35496 [Dorcoceras hygrometricum]|uniref:Uncharacterized protein n=1 Tax=Dorcoceras hygrometricum TaxID=472368 RepID=A0A2Z7CGY6_9LAMI|nr:hypothetical protein F511_35496 [Dorcoceras hygrometricum]